MFTEVLLPHKIRSKREAQLLDRTKTVGRVEGGGGGGRSGGWGGFH